MYEINGKYTNAKVMIDDLDASAVSQIVEMVNNQCFTNPIAIMPDAHAGKGCVVGFTMELSDKLIPNIIGSDIGCGMLSFNVGSNLLSNEKMPLLDEAIRERIPFGASARGKMSKDAMFDWKSINDELRKLCMEYNTRYNMSMAPVVMDTEKLRAIFDRVGCDYHRGMLSIGSLGGGNHFIEIGKDENNDYWVTIHSGSRNFGKCIAEYWQKIAHKNMNEPALSKTDYVEFVKANFDKMKWQDEIAKYETLVGGKSRVGKGTEYLEGKDVYGYLVDMFVAQKYAEMSRYVMSCELVNSIRVVSDTFKGVVQCIETVHNFVDFKDWIIRKGAIRSYKGELMIIPFNMEDGLLIVEGKSNNDWNNSAPHGAGRLFSRSAAKANLDLDMATKSMKDNGIYSSSIPLDEVKGAYKPCEVIEACIEPTATIIHRIKPVMNLKDGQ